MLCLNMTLYKQEEDRNFQHKHKHWSPWRFQRNRSHPLYRHLRLCRAAKCSADVPQVVVWSQDFTLTRGSVLELMGKIEFRDDITVSGRDSNTLSVTFVLSNLFVLFSSLYNYPTEIFLNINNMNMWSLYFPQLLKPLIIYAFINTSSSVTTSLVVRDVKLCRDVV